MDGVEKNLCKLCRLPKKLVRSHVIPEYMYAPVYSAEGAKALAGHYRDYGSELTNSYLIKEGVTEKLLCEKCDNVLIGSLEDYSKTIVDEIKNITFSTPETFIYVDYAKFKLFLLSILWRSSICNHWMFEKIKLGSKHEERIRKSLLLSEPGRPHEYGCVIQVPKNETVKRIMIHSQMDKFQGHHRHLINAPGIHLEFYVSSHTKSIALQPLFLQADGKQPLLQTTESYDNRFLSKVSAMIGIVDR